MGTLWRFEGKNPKKTNNVTKKNVLGIKFRLIVTFLIVGFIVTVIYCFIIYVLYCFINLTNENPTPSHYLFYNLCRNTL